MKNPGDVGHEKKVGPAAEPTVTAPGCLTKDEGLERERERDFGQLESWWHTASVQNALTRSIVALFQDIKTKDTQGQTGSTSDCETLQTDCETSRTDCATRIVKLDSRIVKLVGRIVKLGL